MLNPIESVFAVHKRNVQRLRETHLQALKDIDESKDGQKLQKRTAILTSIVQEGWNQIPIATHSNLYSHTSQYQERCFRKEPIETELNFHSSATQLPLVRLGEDPVASSSSATTTTATSTMTSTSSS